MASFEAVAARSIAETSENAPVYRDIGVRAPATITTSVGNIFCPRLDRSRRPRIFNCYSKPSEFPLLPRYLPRAFGLLPPKIPRGSSGRSRYLHCRNQIWPLLRQSLRLK